MLAQDRITDLRRRLLGAGYQIVPLLTGRKYTYQTDWPNFTGLPDYDRDRANTGLNCRLLRVFDVDVDDAEAAAAVIATIEAMLGKALVHGRADSPRRALVYRSAEGPRPGRNIPLGCGGQVQVLGEGQQLAAFGLHPDGAAYCWYGPDPTEVPIENLPAATEERETALEAALKARWPLSNGAGEETAAGRSNGAAEPRKGRGNGFQNTCLPADVEAALEALPNDYDRAMWIKIGMAAHEGGASFEAFDAWSQKHASYDARATHKAWKSFAKTRSVTVASLFDEVFRRVPGWRKPSARVAKPEADPAGEKGRDKADGEARVQRTDLLSARRLLQTAEDLRGLVSYDVFTEEIILERPIPRPDYGPEKDWAPRPFKETDATSLTEVLISRKLAKASSGLVMEVVRGIAEDVCKHPVRHYLRSLEWDGGERISTWLRTYAGAVCKDPDSADSADRAAYIDAVSRAALIGAVARVMRPGCKHDHVLTLIGPQGIGKSTLLRALVPDPSWFSDSLTRDLGDKDAMVGLAGCWLAEMAELASLNKTDFAMAKAFLSRQVDRFRPPYGRCDVKRPRQTAFFATTNVSEPFKDETGNRRFWPVECAWCDPDGVTRIRDQLWAEAAHYYDSGEKWWLSPEIEAIAAGEQGRRMAVHPLVPAVLEAIGGRAVIEIADILNAWDSRKSEWGRLAPEVAKALRSLGWTSARRLEGGSRAVRWYAPDQG
jgi:predicted P-loop ATPase